MNTLMLQKRYGVPAVAQWAKNLTAAAWVAVKVQIWSLARLSGLKDKVLRCGSQLWLGFSPRPGNFHMPQVWLKETKNFVTCCYFLVCFSWSYISLNFANIVETSWFYFFKKQIWFCWVSLLMIYFLLYSYLLPLLNSFLLVFWIYFVTIFQSSQMLNFYIKHYLQRL